MKKSAHITAFYVEMLLMIVLVTVMVLVLTNVFALGRMDSSRARSLTEAVTLAENAAEAVSAARTPEELRSLLDEDGSVGFVDDAPAPTLRAAYDLNGDPDPDGPLVLWVSWEAESRETGELVRSTIRVFGADTKELYRLETATFVGEGAA